MAESKNGHNFAIQGLTKKKHEGPEAQNRSPEYTGQSQTFNFEI